MPRATSSDNAPVGIESTLTVALSPSFMIEPLPKSFSIFSIASFNALFLSSLIFTSGLSFAALRSPTERAGYLPPAAVHPDIAGAR